MSAIDNRISRARWGADLRAQQEVDDAARDKFLRMVNNAVKENRIVLTPFETEFLEKWAATPVSAKYWTPKRREVADEMKRSYA